VTSVTTAAIAKPATASISFIPTVSVWSGRD
jgi:hypothetical protein